MYAYTFIQRAYTTHFFLNPHTNRRACISMAWVHIYIYAHIYVHKDSTHLNVYMCLKIPRILTDATDYATPLKSIKSRY